MSSTMAIPISSPLKAPLFRDTSEEVPNDQDQPIKQDFLQGSASKQQNNDSQVQHKDLAREETKQKEANTYILEKNYHLITFSPFYFIHCLRRESQLNTVLSITFWSKRDHAFSTHRTNEGLAMKANIDQTFSMGKGLVNWGGAIFQYIFHSICNILLRGMGGVRRSPILLKNIILGERYLFQRLYVGRAPDRRVRVQNN